MVLRVDSVSRRFGPIVACNDVSLTVSPGEVVALLGENGAGKSTLLSVIAGFVTPDAGTVSIDARRLQPGDPARAIQAGVGTAFQHFSLAPELGVRESLELARIDTDRALRHLPSHIHADARIRDLAVPERQQVELLKARMLARHVLLLDEPTSLLGDEDVERVLEQIRDAAAEGTGVVFVTHRLREALSVADRILVMRRGWIVEQVTRPEGGWPEGTEDELLAAMFGEAWQGGMPDLPPSERSAAGATTRYLVRGPLAGRTVDISLEAGRWLAVAGIVGNGQGELVELLSGQTARQITEVPREGASVRHEGHGVADWAARNIAVVPEDRFAEGGAPEMSVGENLALRDLAAGRLSSRGVVSLRAVRRRAEAMIRRWDIRPDDPEVPFGTLSGGNAQRVLLARSLDPWPGLLLAVRPTHGLDHHSVAVVREQLRAAADHGCAVVSIEPELDDAIAYADAIAVIHRGHLSQPMPTGETDRATLQAMMVNGWDE